MRILCAEKPGIDCEFGAVVRYYNHLQLTLCTLMSSDVQELHGKRHQNVAVLIVKDDTYLERKSLRAVVQCYFECVNMYKNYRFRRLLNRLYIVLDWEKNTELF